MSAFADLIRWIITYAVTGGFIHFVAVAMILGAINPVTVAVATIAAVSKAFGE